jgi:hypothetical protein
MKRRSFVAMISDLAAWPGDCRYSILIIERAQLDEQDLVLVAIRAQGAYGPGRRGYHGGTTPP